MAVIEGRLHLEVTDAVRQRIVASDERREFSIGSLADATCKAFCGPRALTRGMNAVQWDIHRRQHVEIARAIFEKGV